MNINRMSLPYPVLGINDDVMPLPTLLNEPVVQTKTHYIFEFDAVIENKEILRLIDEGYAEYTCEVECVKTFLRKCYAQKAPHFHIELPKHSVTETINFDATITVKRPIKEYCDDGFHEDYQGFSFNLEPGDLIGYIASFTYDADIHYDKLQAVGTFMMIDQAKEGEPTSVSLGEQKITIYLPPKMFMSYRNHVSQDKKIASVIHASLVFNALLEALYNYDKFRDKLWARTLAYRIHTEPALQKYIPFIDGDDEGYRDNSEVFNIAQAFLGDPYQRMFNCLNDMVTSIDVTSED